jgi:hypothetical protein
MSWSCSGKSCRRAPAIRPDGEHRVFSPESHLFSERAATRLALAVIAVFREGSLKLKAEFDVLAVRVLVDTLPQLKSVVKRLCEADV